LATKERSGGEMGHTKANITCVSTRPEIWREFRIFSALSIAQLSPKTKDYKIDRKSSKFTAHHQVLHNKFISLLVKNQFNKYNYTDVRRKKNLFDEV